MKKKIQELKKLVESSEKILLINHVKMDPDALGSLATLYFVLEKLGKKVEAVNDLLPPEKFNFLQANHIFKTNLNIEKFNPDLIISFDAGGIGQLGETYKKYKETFDSKDFVVIDHHITNTGFGTLNIIESTFSSTCELLFCMLEEMGWKKYIQSREATLLLAGIIGDTNVFYNTNTRSETLRISADLMDLGADLRLNIYKFFYFRSFNKLKLKAIVLENMKKSEDGKIVYSSITKEDLKKTQTDENDVSGLIFDLINVEGCEIAFLSYPFLDETKVSFRAKSFDVGNFCASFAGGGGHKLAAGLKSKKGIKELEKEILEKLKEQI